MAAELLAAGAEADEAARMQIDGGAGHGGGGAGRPRLLRELGAILGSPDPYHNPSPAPDAALTAAALDAAGALGATRAGAELLIADAEVLDGLAAAAMQASGRASCC